MIQIYSSLLSAFDIFFGGMNAGVKGFAVMGFILAVSVFFLSLPFCITGGKS